MADGRRGLVRRHSQALCRPRGDAQGHGSVLASPTPPLPAALSLPSRRRATVGALLSGQYARDGAEQAEAGDHERNPEKMVL
jgi:hypothetical protein